MMSLSDEDSEREFEKKFRSEGSPLEILEEEEKKQFLKELIDELPSKDQLFIRLFYFEGASPKEIARLLNVTTNAVYSRGNYLREKLKESLRKKISKKRA